MSFENNSTCSRHRSTVKPVAIMSPRTGNAPLSPSASRPNFSHHVLAVRVGQYVVEVRIHQRVFHAGVAGEALPHRAAESLSDWAPGPVPRPQSRARRSTGAPMYASMKPDADSSRSWFSLFL